MKKNKNKGISAIKSIIAVISGLLLLDIAWYSFVIDIDGLKTLNPGKTALMEFRENHRFAGRKKSKIHQVWVPLSKISKNIVRAVVIAEDAKFWNHEGFDYIAIKHALEVDIRKRKIVLGASTITQQLAKNLYLSPSKNPIRKVNEAILTYRIEKNLSKNRILELYLNVIEWGEGIFGIEAASWFYYNKSSTLLDKDQAALLVVILPNPIKYNPLKPTNFILKRSQKLSRAIK
jgi:monofunctional biosynthetic peptidoglycan transglycosylase